MRNAVTLQCFLSILLAIIANGNCFSQKLYSHSFPAMGTEVRFTIYTENKLSEDYFRAASDLVDSLNQVFSDYDPASEVRQLIYNKENDCLPISAPLEELMTVSFDIWKKSDGYFDVSLSNLTKLWREARKKNKWPKKRHIRKALKSGGMQKLRLREDKLCFLALDIGLDFGGIAKGYIGDELINLAQSMGIESILIDLGGDIVCGDPPPKEQYWEIGLEELDTTFQLANQAICTSGDRYQYIFYKGKRYSHLIDPFTGFPVVNSHEVTVISDTGATADAWASAMTIIGKELATTIEMKEGIRIYYH